MTGPRRHPGATTRLRDATRSRSALLDAAQHVFAEKGFAGARVDAIASRAGINKQLIAYYFGSKQGLYDAVAERRQALVAGFDQPDVPLPELARRYVQAFGEHPELERIFLRESLDQDPADTAFDPDVPEVGDLRRRQAAGEIAADIDPAFLLLFLQAMTLSGSLLPAEAKRLTGLDPRSAEFREQVAAQLSTIVRRLA